MGYELKRKTALTESIDAVADPRTITREGIIAAACRNDPREYIAKHADPSRVKSVKNGKSMMNALKKFEVRP